MFTEKDLRQIEARGLTLGQVEAQLENFRRGFPFLKVVRAASPGDGVTLLDLFKNPSLEKGDVWGESDPKYNGDDEGLSYGRYPDGAEGQWQMTSPTEGTANVKGDVAISWE